jgi:hypothetical protein
VVEIDHREVGHKEVGHRVVAGMHCVEVAHNRHLGEIGAGGTRLADQGREKIHLDFERRMYLRGAEIEGDLRGQRRIQAGRQKWWGQPRKEVENLEDGLVLRRDSEMAQLNNSFEK